VRRINAQIKKLRQDKVDDAAQAAEFDRLKKDRTRVRSGALQRTADTEEE
jgi:hypothetical protein